MVTVLRSVKTPYSHGGRYFSVFGPDFSQKLLIVNFDMFKFKKIIISGYIVNIRQNFKAFKPRVDCSNKWTKKSIHQVNSIIMMKKRIQMPLVVMIKKRRRENLIVNFKNQLYKPTFNRPEGGKHYLASYLLP